MKSREAHIEWTGERCVPWAADTAMVYEHLHRYHWARQFCAGADVLDYGSGEGYGSAILAADAKSVLGIDVDALAVAHARQHHEAANLRFAVTGPEASVLDEHRFDVVVCFEVIEHVSNPQWLLTAAASALREGGVLVLSTPNGEQAGRGKNPFHVKEYSLEELDQMLAPHFDAVAVYRQAVTVGSDIRVLRAPPMPARWHHVDIVRDDNDWRERDTPPEAGYFLIGASKRDLPPIARRSVLVDEDLVMLRHAENAAVHARDETAVETRLLRTRIAELEAEVLALENWRAVSNARMASLASLNVRRARALAVRFGQPVYRAGVASGLLRGRPLRVARRLRSRLVSDAG